jgi:hypothetical protein
MVTIFTETKTWLLPSNSVSEGNGIACNVCYPKNIVTKNTYKFTEKEETA